MFPCLPSGLALRSHAKPPRPDILKLQEEEEDVGMQLQLLEGCVQKLHKDKTETEVEFQALQAKMAVSAEELEVLRGKAETGTKHETTQAEKSAHSRQLRALQVEKDTSLKEKAAAEAELQALRAQMAASAEELKVVRGEKAGAEAELQLMRQEKANSDAELEALRKEKAKTDAKYETTRSEASTYLRQLRALQVEKDVSLKEKAAAEAELQALQAQMAASAEELKVVRGEKSGAEAELQLMQQNKAKSAAELEAPRKDTAESDAKHETSQESKASGPLPASSLRRRESGFRPIVADREGDVREQIARFQEKKAGLAGDLEIARAKSAKSGAELETLRRAISTRSAIDLNLRSRLAPAANADAFSSSTSRTNRVEAIAPKLVPRLRQSPARTPIPSVATADRKPRDLLRQDKVLPGFPLDGNDVYVGA